MGIVDTGKRTNGRGGLKRAGNMKAGAFSPDGRTIAIADSVAVRLWDEGSREWRTAFIRDDTPRSPSARTGAR